MKSCHLCKIRIEIESLAPNKNSRPVLSNQVIEILGGQVTCLLGPSGAGKTTLLRLLAGDLSVHFKGSVTFKSKDGDILTGPQATQKGLLGLLSPDLLLPPWLRLRELFIWPSQLNKALVPPATNQVKETLKAVRLPASAAEYYPSELSYGMRCRVLYALATLYSPQFLLVDEILSTLDPPLSEMVCQSIRLYCQQTGAACLLITHDISLAANLTDTFLFKSLNTSLTPVTGPSRATTIRALFDQEHAQDLNHEAA